LKPFILSGLISFTIFSVFKSISFKAETSKISNRDGYLAVTLSWVVFCLLGSLPYILSGSIPTFINAFFESVSGFTTTGASILSDVERLPYSVLFWRSFTHWIGGIGIIVLVIIVLPSLRITAQQLFSLESSLKEKIHPKTKAIGLRILFIYLGLTITEVLFLWYGEMNLFDSVCHTFGTVATGGFSTKNSSLAAYSSYSQYVVTIYMLLAGISYVVYYYIVKLQFIKIRHNSELWFYLATIMAMGLLVTGILLSQTGKPLEAAFREGFFQVISIITTTGYANADYLLWPAAGVTLIFVLYFAGASTGSSTGSIKMARHFLVLKNIRFVFTRLVHPNSVMQIRFNNKLVTERANRSVLSFVVLFLFIFLTGSVLIVITGVDPVTAASAAASALGNVGPGLGSIGPMFNYSHLEWTTKLIVISLMIVGRLEILTVFALFTRSFWKL
jgi:trk system potassium uptake protein TrkH